MRGDREESDRLPNMLSLLFLLCLSPIEKQIVPRSPGQAAGRV